MHVRSALLATLLVTWAPGCGTGGGTAPTTRKTFTVPHLLEVSGRATRVMLGDFTGDGIPDLALFDSASASVGALDSTALRESPTLPSTGGTKRLARGAAAYAPGSMALVGATASDMCIADMDLDGRPDLVVAGGLSGEVSVWPSQTSSSGTFRYHRWQWVDASKAPSSVDRVAVGDVNGDGRPDLVTLDEATGQAHVLLQDPFAPFSFVPGNDPPPVGACRGLVVADVDRDGDLDLLTNRPDADVVSLLLPGGAAGWMLRESPTRRSTGRSMAVGDVDGDGWLDVVVLVEGGASVMCLRQRPTEPGVFDATESPLGIAVNEEGTPVSQLCIDEPGTARAGMAIKEQGIRSPALAMGGPGCPGAARCVCQDGIALADMDRDGALDLLLSPTDTDADNDPFCAFAIRESPTRRFGAAERFVPRLRESPSRPSMGRLCAVGDLDADGHVDLITGDPDFDLLRIHYVHDSVPPAAPSYCERLRIVPTAQTTGRGVPCDLDRDGLQDLVCATGAGIEIRWQDPTAPGTYSQPTVLGPGQSFVDLALGDLNNDGCPDMVVGMPGACAALLRDPLKPREFLPPIAFPPSPGGNFRSLALGDVDGDGLLDCVAIRESPSKASLSRGRGQGFFDVFTELSVAVLDPLGVAVADLDGDGRLDLAVCGTDASCVVLQDPLVPLAWTAPQVLARMGGVRVATGDVNGDGRCDVITCGDGGVAVARQSALEAGRFLPSYALSLEVCGGLAVGDLDRDGALDVCFVEVKQGTLVCTGGDPDFDLLRVISLNGLPPGVASFSVSLALGDVDGDGKADILGTSPSDPGAASGAMSLWSDCGRSSR